MRSAPPKMMVMALAAALASACGGLARNGSTDDPVSNPKQTFPNQTSGSSLPPKSGDSVAQNTIPSAPAKPPEDPKLEAERARLMGMWVKGCVAGGVGEASSRAAIEFTKKEFNIYVFKYQDNNCQIQSSQSRVAGNYVLFLAEHGVNAIDMIHGEQVYYRFFTDQALKDANANKVCGRSWAQGKEAGCAENASSDIHTIVKVTDDSLAFGALDASHDGSASDKRPSAADEAGAYQKKK